jgi:hypothetical protein
MVGSYSSTKWLWMSWIVKQDFPTPPPPTTTSLYSRRNCRATHQVSKADASSSEDPNGSGTDGRACDRDGRDVAGGWSSADARRSLVPWKPFGKCRWEMKINYAVRPGVKRRWTLLPAMHRTGSELLPKTGSKQDRSRMTEGVNGQDRDWSMDFGRIRSGRDGEIQSTTKKAGREEKGIMGLVVGAWRRTRASRAVEVGDVDGSERTGTGVMMASCLGVFGWSPWAGLFFLPGSGMERPSGVGGGERGRRRWHGGVEAGQALQAGRRATGDGRWGSDGVRARQAGGAVEEGGEDDKRES